MTPEQWIRIEKILDEVLDLEPGNWSAHVDKACEGDPDLRREVMDLLSRYPEVDGILGGSAVDLMPPVEENLVGRSAGTSVGPYRLVREIARGGMGTVFVAERDTGTYQQTVALKLLRSGLTSDDAGRRFESEQQILAGLSHPGIARLLDGGVAESAGHERDGQPYLAMEYVDGCPIDVYCDDHQLSVETRLRLFAHVCEAVDYAHRNLVIHRDLKPSNILVTDNGEVKLLDFGIAKLLDETGSAVTPETKTGRHWMTPEYAAPEQISGGAVTTATDAYQLGVVLYELLTGRRPFGRTENRLPAMAQAVLHEAPAKPSTAVTRSVDHGVDGNDRIDPESVSLARSTQPDRLRRTLRGDLDSIVLKALRKEPADRYQSAEAFLEDVRRFLSGHPVEARKGSRVYRARKFVRRHRWGVAAAVILALLLAGYALTVTIQTAQIRRALDQARLETEKSEQVTGFLMGLFEANDPREARGDSVTARELLAKGLQHVETLEDQPEVQSAMLDVMGRVYYSIGRYDEARPLLERAVELRRSLYGDRHLDLAESLSNLARVFRVRGDGDEAETLFLEAIEIRRELLGSEHPEIAETLNNLAMVNHNRGDSEEAERLYRASLSMRRELLGNEHADVATSLNNLGLLLMQQGDYEGAEAFHREALTMRRKIFGADHLDVTYSLNNLALVLHNSGDYEAAEKIYREDLVLRTKLYGPVHPEVAVTIHNLAAIERDRGNLVAAESLFEVVVDMRKEIFGDNNHNVAVSLHGLATVIEETGDCARAEPVFREAVRVSEASFGPDHHLTAHFKSWVGECLIQLRRFEEAEALLLEAHSVLGSKSGIDHRFTQAALERIVTLYETLGRIDEAGPYRAMLTADDPP